MERVFPMVDKIEEEKVVEAAKQALADRDAARAAAIATAQATSQTAQTEAMQTAQNTITAAEQQAKTTIEAAKQVEAGAIAAANASFESDKISLEGDLLKVQQALQDAQAHTLSVDSAAKLSDLGLARSRAIQLVRDLPDVAPGKDASADEHIAYDARLRLAQEAQRRAEADYNDALASIQSDHLMELLK